MNDRRKEVACWRIWYRLKQRGECSQQNLTANCGLNAELAKAALQTLIDIGQVEYTAKNDETLYSLADDKARMMQVFPNLEVPAEQ